MSKQNNGGPAFPMQDAQAIHAFAAASIADVVDPNERDKLYAKARAEAVGGISIRDYFAAKAIQGLAAHITGPNKRGNETAAQAHARVAYQYADAMLAAREGGAA